MNGLSLYILRQILGPLLVFTFCLTGLVWLTQSLRLLDVIINQGQSAWTFIELAVFLLPSLLALILPIALFCAVVFTLHRMHADSELVVMWSAGFGRWGVARPVLFLALWVAILGYAVSLYFMPAGMRALKDRVFQIRGDLVSVLLHEGSFTTPIDNVTVFVRETTRTGEILNILVHDSRNPAELTTYIAERGLIVRKPDGAQLVMKKGSAQRLTGDRHVALLNFDQHTIDLGQFTADVTTKVREASERYLPELLSPDPTNPYDAKFWDRLVAEGHGRLTGPLYAIALTMVALAGLVSGHFARRGYGERIAYVVLIALLVRLSGLGIQNAAAKVPALNAVQYLLPLFSMGVAAFMLHPRFDVLLDRLHRRRSAAVQVE